MFKFKCKDMGMDCEYAVTAATKEEVMDIAMAHAVETHAEVLQGLAQEQIEEMNAKLTSVITDVETEEIVAENNAVVKNDDAVGGDEGEDDEEGDDEGEDDKAGEDAVTEEPDEDVEDEEDSEEETAEAA